jgi:hypothetical protein
MSTPAKPALRPSTRLGESLSPQISDERTKQRHGGVQHRREASRDRQERVREERERECCVDGAQNEERASETLETAEASAHGENDEYQHGGNADPDRDERYRTELRSSHAHEQK